MTTPQHSRSSAGRKELPVGTDNRTGDHKSETLMNFSVKEARGIRYLSCQNNHIFSYWCNSTRYCSCRFREKDLDTTCLLLYTGFQKVSLQDYSLYRAGKKRGNKHIRLKNVYLSDSTVSGLFFCVLVFWRSFCFA
jgi:hypothetical protein